MKKILLLLSVFICVQASAQHNETIFTGPKTADNFSIAQDFKITQLSKQIKQRVAKKSRAGAGWMSYQDAISVTGLTSAGRFPLTADSNMYQPAGTPNPFYWYLHLLGTSFDPTSARFYQDPNRYYNGFEVTANDAFAIDSVNVIGLYERNRTNQVDTLIVELTYSTATNAFDLQYQPDPFWASLGLTDSILRFATATYDNTGNKMSDSCNPKVTVRKILDAAAATDLVDGLNQWNLALPTSLNVPAGSNVVAFARFAPGVAVPFGQVIDSSNYWTHYVIEEDGDGTLPKPSTGNSNTGLASFTEDRYRLLDGMGDPDYSTFQGSQILTPTYNFTAPSSLDDPYFGFYVNCPTCVSTPLATDNVTIFDDINIYPNPATNNLNITLSEIKNADMNITLYSMTGKKLISDVISKGANSISLDIAGLANGIYLCELEIEGQTTTQKISKK